MTGMSTTGESYPKMVQNTQVQGSPSPPTDSPHQLRHLLKRCPVCLRGPRSRLLAPSSPPPFPLSETDLQGFRNALEWAGKETCAGRRAAPAEPLAPSSASKHPPWTGTETKARGLPWTNTTHTTCWTHSQACPACTPLEAPSPYRLILAQGTV